MKYADIIILKTNCNYGNYFNRQLEEEILPNIEKTLQRLEGKRIKLTIEIVEEIIKE